MTVAGSESVADPALTTKVICLVLFGVISLCCGLFPMVLSRVANCWRSHQREEKSRQRISARLEVLVSCVLCLGGGVLMGTVFTHMLPEIRRLFTQIENANLLPGMQTPAGEIFVCIGFFLVYLVEELVHHFLAGRKSIKEEGLPLTNISNGVKSNPGVEDSAGSGQVHGDHEAMAWNDRLYASGIAPSPSAAVSTAGGHSHEHNSSGHDHGSAIATLQAFRAHMVIIALSIHSIFEGFAVAFETKSRDVWLLFAAIATHKAIVSFCLGEQLLETKRSVCFIFTNVFLLAAASPLGVSLGLVIEQLDTDESSRLITTGVLQSLAAGTVLYVVFFEILAVERQKHSYGILKFFAVVAGFSLIILVQSSSGHSHGAPSQGQGIRYDRQHLGHEHDTHKETHPIFDSDYMARVHNESGHVLDTVRYIQSFRRQETDDVTHQAIIDSMRSVVQEIAGEPVSHHTHEMDNHRHHAAGEMDNGHNKTNEQLTFTENSHHNFNPKIHGENDDKQGQEIGTYDPQFTLEPDNRAHEDRDEPSLNQINREDGLDRDYSDSIKGDSSEDHLHDHDKFMRTVENLVESLSEVDPDGIDKTLRLMDKLDLIASQGTGAHHLQNGTNTHQVSEVRESTDRALSHHYDDEDHVHFVLQDAFTTYPGATDRTDDLPEYTRTLDQEEPPLTTQIPFQDHPRSLSMPEQAAPDHEPGATVSPPDS